MFIADCNAAVLRWKWGHHLLPTGCPCSVLSSPALHYAVQIPRHHQHSLSMVPRGLSVFVCVVCCCVICNVNTSPMCSWVGVSELFSFVSVVGSIRSFLLFFSSSFSCRVSVAFVTFRYVSSVACAHVWFCWFPFACWLWLVVLVCFVVCCCFCSIALTR